jgi:hypothetical protein
MRMNYREKTLIPYSVNEKYRLDCVIFVVFMIVVGVISHA